MKNLLKKHAEKLRFGAVGLINTAIDFSVLFILVSIGLPDIASNFISTSTALIFSFFANKTFTFKNSEDTTGKHFAYFLMITLFGLWVLQPIVIESTKILIQPLNLTSKLVLLIGKVLATGVSLVWNYILYQKFVFRKKPV